MITKKTLQDEIITRLQNEGFNYLPLEQLQSLARIIETNYTILIAEEKIKALSDLIQTMLTDINYEGAVSKLTILKANQLLAALKL